MQIRSSSCCCAGDYEATSEPACSGIGGFTVLKYLAQQFSRVKENLAGKVNEEAAVGRIKRMERQPEKALLAA